MWTEIRAAKRRRRQPSLPFPTITAINTTTENGNQEEEGKTRRNGLTPRHTEKLTEGFDNLLLLALGIFFSHRRRRPHSRCILGVPSPPIETNPNGKNEENRSTESKTKKPMLIYVVLLYLFSPSALPFQRLLLRCRRRVYHLLMCVAVLASTIHTQLQRAPPSFVLTINGGGGGGVKIKLLICNS